MTKKDVIIEYINKNGGLTNSEIAKLLVSKNVIFKGSDVENVRKQISKIRNSDQKYITKTNSEKITIKDTDFEIDKNSWLKKEVENQTLKERNSENNKKVQFLQNELLECQRRLDVALDIKPINKEFLSIKPYKGRHDSEATAFMIGSDWHIEERIDPSTINNMNEYNLDIAKDSVKNFFERGLRLVNISGKDVAINNIVLAMLGDIIHGYIHDEFIEDNYLSPIQSTMLGIDLIGSGIEFLLKNSKCDLIVPCKVGNHGRVGQDKKIATEYKNSFEYMMYHAIAKEFKNESRVRFIIENGYFTYLNVYDSNMRFHHGHNIKYNGGIGGITVPVNKAIAQWDKERTVDLDVFGHYHQLKLDTGSDKFVSNGSICGYNAYSVFIKAGYEEPKQAFFLWDKHRGKTVSAPIFVR